MTELVRVNMLRPGHVLRQTLFTRQGIRLLPAGTTISEGVYKALCASGEPMFVLARSVEDLGAVQPELPPLPATRARRALVSAGGVAVATPGDVIEEHHADALALGVFTPAPRPDSLRGDITPAGPRPPGGRPPFARPWAVRHGDLARVRAAMLKVSDELVAQKQAVWERIPRVVSQGIDQVDLSAPPGAGWTLAARQAEIRTAAVARQRRLLAGLVAGVPIAWHEIEQPIIELIRLLEQCPRQYAELGCRTPRRPDYLPDHMWTVAVLTVGIAARLGWSRRDVLYAGAAGLLADAGMAMVPAEIRLAERPLDEAEINRVRRHVMHGVVMLGAISGLPPVVELAVHQHHERENGAGYPRGSPAAQIHPISKAVAVADIFAGCTAPRPHRPAPLSYAGMQQIIAMSSGGELERRSVRAMLELCGLFPIGGFVRLSDSSIARVVGANPEQIDRPIIERWSRQGPGPVIDLASVAPWELHVLEAIDDPSTPFAVAP